MGVKFHTTESDSQTSRNIPKELEEIYPGNVGDAIIRDTDGTFKSKPIPSSPGNTSGGQFFEEKLTVSAVNALSQLSYTPRPGAPFFLGIRGIRHSLLSGDFSIVGKNIVIAPGGYSIQPDWYAWAEYWTDDVITAPTVIGFAPTTASVGASVVITGTGFNGVQSVVIGGITQTNYTVNSPTQITVTLISGAYSGGNVVVITASGTGSKSGFTYLDPTPTITSLSTTLSAIGNTVVITGTNFTSVLAVKFGGVNAASFIVNSATQITAVIADTGATGTVQIQTVYGTATSAQSITLVQILAHPRAGQVMTANTTVLAGVTYTASGNANNAGQEPYQAFTLNSAVFYFGVTQNGTEYLQLQASLKFKESTYTVFTANQSTNYIPKSWVYEASNDGTSWVQLDARTNQALAANSQYDFAVTSNAGYYFYRRIRITATQAVGWPPALRLRFNP